MGGARTSDSEGVGSEETAESESRVDRMSRLSAPPEICVRRLESRRAHSAHRSTI